MTSAIQSGCYKIIHMHLFCVALFAAFFSVSGKKTKLSISTGSGTKTEWKQNQSNRIVTLFHLDASGYFSSGTASNLFEIPHRVEIGQFIIEPIL